MSRQQKPRRLPLRRHSLAGPRPTQQRQREEGGRSFFRFIMSRPWKQRSTSSPSIDSESRSASHHHDNTNEGAESSVRVVATVLQPQLYYKSVPVTVATTVNDIIVSLVSKYAIAAEDKDPNSFYLMETHDRRQGSYSRVLPNSELVGSVIQRWGEDSGYFSLTKRPTTARSEPLFSSSPSLFSSGELFPYPAFVEEGSSQLSSQSLSDVSMATADCLMLPKKHGSTPHPNIASLVSPYSNGASSKATRMEKNVGSSSWLQDTGGFSMTYSRDSTPLSPTSPLIVDSPTHQYIVTGSSSAGNHSNESFHGNESGGGVSHFHFPSANPSSPTEVESNHGNTPINSPSNGDEAGASSEEMEGGRGGREMTPGTERRWRLSEMMMTSVEGGLGQIMAQVVEEGREGQGGEGDRGEEGEREDQTEGGREEVEREEEREGATDKTNEEEVEREEEREGATDKTNEEEVEREEEREGATDKTNEEEVEREEEREGATDKTNEEEVEREEEREGATDKTNEEEVEREEEREGATDKTNEEEVEREEEREGATDKTNEEEVEREEEREGATDKTNEEEVEREEEREGATDKTNEEEVEREEEREGATDKTNEEEVEREEEREGATDKTNEEEVEREEEREGATDKTNEEEVEREEEREGATDKTNEEEVEREEEREGATDKTNEEEVEREEEREGATDKTNEEEVEREEEREGATDKTNEEEVEREEEREGATDKTNEEEVEREEEREGATDKTNEEEAKKDAEKETLQSEVVTMVMTLDSSPRPIARATLQSRRQESSLTVSRVCSTSASFDQPNLSDQFESAMDILDSFSVAMDEKFGTPQNGTETKTGTESRNETQRRSSLQAPPTTPKGKPEKPVDLVSPRRRNKLMDDAARRFPFKRAHTFDVGAGHAPSSHAHPRKKGAEPDLVSKARKERLMNQALATMRQRFSKSLSTHSN